MGGGERDCDDAGAGVLRTAEHGDEASALAQLLGVPTAKVNDDRLYRALDQWLPHKQALEKHLKQRLGELFQLDYGLLLYDVTSTCSKAKRRATRNPGEATGAITGRTASKSTSLWW